MGMFDTLRCSYPLPLAGANDLEYQTKSLNCQMERYELRADGTLWRETDDGVQEQELPTREVRFYEWLEPDGWLEWSAYFKAGILQQINLIEHTPKLPPLESATTADAVDPHVADSGKPPTRV
jgi:hypothetical protein